MKLTPQLIALALFFVLAAPAPAWAVRIKDIASFSGVRDNQLVGYGLVVGLGGTGDSKDAPFTNNAMVNMMEKMGVAVDAKTLKARNVASVMVTANLPVSAKAGSSIDVTISSIGNATSLAGGVLLQTPLKGIDGKIYAMAQGATILGGFTVDGAAARTQKNISTVASIPGGAVVEREVPFEFNTQRDLTISMSIADFSTAQQVVERLNQSLGGNYATALNPSTIKLQVPPSFQGNLVPLMASVENLEVTPETAARVVVDEKTGTIVIGRDVRIARVAVAQGSLQVTVQESQQVSQPLPFSQGQTVVTPQTNTNVREERRNLNIVEGATLQELVDGLNSIGATPRDLISILKSLKASGALYADLQVI